MRLQAYLATDEIAQSERQGDTRVQNEGLTGLGYRPDIDGLRAVAIVAVLLFHANSELLPGGFCGVDVFFVISGFLITGIILQEIQTGRFSFGQFYARRARRLFPALVLALLTTFVVGWLTLLPEEFKQLGKDAVAGAAFSSNLFLYADTVPYFSSTDRPLIHLWSLGVEEQFYFLWPTVVYIAWKLGKNWIRVVAAVIIVASFLENVAVVSFDSPAAFYLPWNRLWELSVGAALAGMQRRSVDATNTHGSESKIAMFSWFRRQLCNMCGLVGATLLVASFGGLRSGMEFPGFWGLLPSTGTALIILAGPQGWPARYVLCRQPMVFVGLISYPLYLWHWSLLCFARLVEPVPKFPALLITAVLLVAFILAAATYKFIELPIRRRRGAPLFLIATCYALACCAVIGCLVYAQYIPPRGVSKDVARILPSRKEVWSTTRNIPWDAVPKSFIEIGSSPTKTLYIGDSFMEQYLPRIERVVVNSKGRANAAIFAVRGACSLPYEFSWALGKAACKRHVDKALAYAKRRDVDTVVIASAWFVYFMTESHGRWITKPESLPALVRFRETIADLRKMKKRVYIVLIGPVDEKLDPLSRIRRTVLSPGFQAIDVPSPTKQEILGKYGGIQVTLKQIASDTGAIIIDPMNTLCDHTTCPAVTAHGEPMYVDSGHQRPSYVRENARFVDETLFPLPLKTSSDYTERPGPNSVSP